MIRGFLAVLVSSVVAVPVTGGWVRGYGPMRARAEALVSLADGGAAVLTGGMKNILFTTDASGNVVAVRELKDQSWFLVRGADALYAGGAKLSLNEGPQLQLVKLDQKLGVTWTARLVPAEAKVFQPSAATVTRDGGLIIAGSADDAAFVLRMAADGRVEWARQLDASGRDRVNAVVQTRDGGIVCAGWGRASPWLVKLSAKGELTWSQVYLKALHGFDTVVEAADGDLIAATAHVLIVRTSSDGATKWQRTLKVEGVESTTLVSMVKDMFALSMRANKQAVLLSFRGDGSQLWQQTLTAGDGDELTGPSFVKNADLVFSAGGLFYAPPIKRKEGWESVTYLFRIDADGTTGCPWFSPSSTPFVEASFSAERLDLEFEPLTFEKASWESRVTTMSLAAAPVACAAPVAAAPAATSVPTFETPTFDRFAITRKQGREWESLLRAKDFARLESIAAELRAKPWSADPLHWDIATFYGVLNWTESIEEATTLATVREWIAARPQSITPKIALAQAHYDAAAKRRGGGFTDTVTAQDWSAYQKLLGEADQILAALEDAEDDPHYWALSVRLAHHRGRDPVEVARRAARHTHNPDVFVHAAVALTPLWGTRVAEFRPFVEEAAALTRASMGEGIYAWIAYQARFMMGEDAAALGLDWPRARQGLRDLIRLAPAWIPTYHRLALMARRANDRATAREMFQRKELDWYEGAQTMWSRMSYDAAREWALTTPAEPFINNAPNAAASALTAPVSEWPQMVMQNDVVLDGVLQPPVASFLVETPSGVVAVSAVPDDTSARHLRERLTSWTMAASATPKREFKVQTIDTQNAPENQRGVALVLAPVQGKLPVHVLKPYAPDRPPRLGTRIFVVSCAWSGRTCTQAITAGKLASGDRSPDDQRVTYFLKLEKPSDPGLAVGSVVLDENGQAIAVVNGRASTTTETGPLLDAEDLRSIIRR